jgi:uncharacterized protein (UPF0332 family)
VVTIISIDWCKKQGRGIKLTDPNENLAKEYVSIAEETLVVLKNLAGKSNVWLATTQYYCEYFMVYALLMRLGIRCEMHECTILVSDFLEKEGLVPDGTYNKLKKDKKLRINNQYYLKNLPVNVDYDRILNFVLTIKDTIGRLTLQKVDEIREKIDNYKPENGPA